MTGLEIRLDGDRYVAGQPVTGRVVSTGQPGPVSVTVSLTWYTEGKGDSDSGVAAESPLYIRPGSPHPFTLTAPLLPPSYRGILLKIHWIVRLRMEDDDVVDCPITIVAG